MTVDFAELMKNVPFDIGIIMDTKSQELFDVECPKHRGVQILEKAHGEVCGCDNPKPCFRKFIQTIAHDLALKPEKFEMIVDVFRAGENSSSRQIFDELGKIMSRLMNRNVQFYNSEDQESPSRRQSWEM